MNNTTYLKTNFMNYSIIHTKNEAIKIDFDCFGFGYSEVLPIDTIITDSTIDLKKIKMLIVGDNSIFIISDELYTDKEFIRPEFEYFDNFQFYEVVAIPSKDVNSNVNNIVNTLETSPKGIIENIEIKQDIQNITDTKKIDFKPDLSLLNDNINTFDYNNISIYDVCDKLNMKELKTYPNYKTFECFNKTAHKKGGAFTIYNNDKGFKCFGGKCNIKGSNNVELVKQFFNINEDEAIKWLKENFQDSNYSFIPSQAKTQIQSEPEGIKTDSKKYKGRVIDKHCNKDYRFLALTENEIDKVEITQDIIDKIEIELNKKYSIKTFELLKEFVFIGNGTKTNTSYTSLRIFTGYENIKINNNSKINIISEGLTDSLTAVELYKDNFQDYNFIQRHNKTSKFDFNLTDINILFIDSDDNETNIKELIQESKQDITGKKFYIVEFKQDKDLSDYHFKMNFDSNKTKEYIEKNKKELVIIPNLPELLPGDVTHKQKLEIFSKTDKDKIQIDINKLFKHLSNCGFFIELNNNGDFEYYKKEGNFIENITKNKMVKFLSNQVETQTPKYKALYTDYKKKYFNSINYFDTLPELNFNELLRDSKDVINLTFNNCIVEITKDNIKIKKYTSEKILKTNNKYNSINRNFNIDSFNSFTEIDYKNSIAYKFFENVSRNENKEIDNNRFEILQRIIGYYLHKFKNRVYPFAYVLTDFNNSDVANGGSGKGLTCQLLNCYRNLSDVDGKNINTDNSRFIFENITKYNDIVATNDLKFTFDIDILYNAITDNFTVEGKNKPKQVIDFEISPKIILTANRPLKIDGGSSKRRFIEFEYSNYYNTDNKPNTDFNKQLMTDFTTSDWFYSDMFFIECCKKYLQMGAVEKIENTFIDKNRFIEKYKMIGDVMEYLTEFFSNEFENIQEIYNNTNNANNKNIIRKDATGFYINIEVLNSHCKENFKGSVNNISIKQFSKFNEMITELNKINFNKNLEIVKKRFGSFGNQTKEIYCYKVTDLKLQTQISNFID